MAQDYLEAVKWFRKAAEQNHAEAQFAMGYCYENGDGMAEDEEEAIRIANSLPYGLAAGVWTENIGRALTMAKRLEAGTVWVNTYRAVSYMAPFGGYKRSGLGRENGMDMIKEYLQTKSVWIDMGNEVPNPFVLR